MKVYIVHGWTYTTDKWEPLVEMLKNNNYEVEMLKVPGLTAESDKSWTLEEYVEWLKNSLSEDDSPIVIAHSNGGRIAMSYDAKYPNHLKQLILIDSAGVERKDISHKSKQAVLKPIAKMLKPVIGNKTKSAMYKSVGASDYDKADENMKITMQNMLASDAVTPVEDVTVPVTLVWGSDDGATPIATGEELQDRLPNVQSWNVINGANHSPHFTNTEQVFEIINSNIEK